MGLDITKSNRATVSAASTGLAVAAVATVLLTPAIYERYVRSGVLFEKGVPYRFTQEQADVLLEETEEGTDKPLWKKYKAPAVSQQLLQAAEAAANPRSVDMTNAPVTELPAGEEIGGESKRIEIGGDDELAELLGPDGSNDAGVTV